MSQQNDTPGPVLQPFPPPAVKKDVPLNTIPPVLGTGPLDKVWAAPTPGK